MRGLRTQENEKFEKFFSLVQQEAAARDAVFYLDAGDGNEYCGEQIECEDLMGWLIPNAMTAAFEPLWKQWRTGDAWSDYYIWAVWELDNGTIKVRLEEA